MKNLTPAMALALCANFGSVESWRTAFAAAAGAGEMRLVFSPSDGRLLNRRKDAATSAPGDAVPLLTLSGTSPAQTDAALAALDWAEPYERYQHAVHAASESFGAQRGDIAAALLLDVRRAGVYAQSAVTLPGARWLDPARVAEWSADLPRSREIVVYCVYGHEVSRATALRLRALGLAARYLHGGIDGWQATGLPLTRKDGSV